MVLFLFKTQRFEDRILSASSGGTGWNLLSWAQSLELVLVHALDNVQKHNN
jgi:hypothetical protein